jgi:hypothetical protein
VKKQGNRNYKEDTQNKGVAMGQKRVKELKRLAHIVALEQIETPGGRKIKAAFGDTLGLAKMTGIMYDVASRAYHKTPRPLRHVFFRAAHGKHRNPALIRNALVAASGCHSKLK